MLSFAPLSQIASQLDGSKVIERTVEATAAKAPNEDGTLGGRKSHTGAAA